MVHLLGCDCGGVVGGRLHVCEGGAYVPDLAPDLVGVAYVPHHQLWPASTAAGAHLQRDADCVAAVLQRGLWLGVLPVLGAAFPETD